jgi:hypothetical protein
MAFDTARPVLSLVRGTRPAAGRRPSTARRADGESPLPPGRLAAVTDRCWRCRTKVRAVVGLLVDPGATADGTGFLPFDAVADALAERLDERVLAARGIGPLRHRDSPGVAGGYVSNGCPECDALIGRFTVADLLAEHLARGGTLRQLDVGVRVGPSPLAVSPRRWAAR